MEQVALGQVLQFDSSNDGVYTLKLPRSVCYGVVASGGITIAAIHKAAINFVAHEPKVSAYPDVLNITIEFYRPTLCAPNTSTIQLGIRNANKTGAVLHFQLSQKKLCLEGHINLTKFSAHRGITAGMDFAFLPPPPAISLSNLESDINFDDPNWFRYLRAFQTPGPRKPLSYIEYFLPKTINSMSHADHWLRPGWSDDSNPNGAVWTNELLHFVIDNAFPLWLNESDRADHHRRIMRVAEEQRQSLKEGRTDGERNVEREDVETANAAATLAMSTQIKRLLPEEGVKWLFMRAMTTGIEDGRTSLNIVVADQHGRVVASSQHVVILVEWDVKSTKL